MVGNVKKKSLFWMKNKKDTKTGRDEDEDELEAGIFLKSCWVIGVCVCVCVCMREREREKWLLHSKNLQPINWFNNNDDNLFSHIFHSLFILSHINLSKWEAASTW